MRGCTAAGVLDDTQYSRPLPWIGLYVAAASLLCATAMACDACSGFRRRKLWFPSRLFSLNAATLTLLGVATKFPVDLNTSMPRRADQLTKLSGTVLICTAMANFMPSLGAMDDSDVLSNVVAVGILVVTIVVNVGIQMGTGVIYVFVPEHAIIMLLMVVLLVILISTALTVPTTRQLLDTKAYHKSMRALAEEEGENSGNNYTLPKLKRCMKKCWLVSHTCSPQFVLGRSATCSASGALCLVSASVFTEALLRAFFIKHSHLEFCSGSSDYQWSTKLVLIAQAAGVLIGTVAPVYRWLYASSSRSVEGRRWSCRDAFKVEYNWVQRLNEWKAAILPLRPGSGWVWKIAHRSKNSVLAVLIKLQLGVVRASNLVWLVPILMGIRLKKDGLVRKMESFPTPSQDTNVELEAYVFCQESERDLIKLITRSELKNMEILTEMGRKNQPTALVELIKRHSTISQGFKEVFAFDSERVLPMVPEKPQLCWALPVVTLAGVAVALPGIDRRLVGSLLRGVREGLRYVRLIEKNLEVEAQVLYMWKVADKIWLDISLYNRWFGLDLQGLVLSAKDGKTVLEAILDVAKNRAQQFQGKLKAKCGAKGNAVEWAYMVAPACLEKVLAANCMYRVCATILQDYDAKHRTENNLFDWLQRTVSDILGACLTNLPKTLYTRCLHCPKNEVRRENVWNAARMLGEAEDILEILESPQVTRSFPEQTTYIDDWWQRVQMHPSSCSNNTTSSATSDELCISLD